MNENEKPVIGTTEAAVLTCVELIARAAQMSEAHMAYYLDLYYQIRSWHEVEKYRLQPAAPAEPETAADVTDNDVGSKTENTAGGEPSPVLRGRETIKLQENAKSETRSESARKQKAEEKNYKMMVADLLRDARARGVKVPGIVQASGGKLTDGAVLSILAGEFRPIADYRALAAALDKLAGDHNN